MPINLKTHIQMQSKIMKKRQRKKNNKNVFIPLLIKRVLKQGYETCTCDGVRVSDELS